MSTLDELLSPVDLILHCPNCGRQHIDQSEPSTGWTNPPHKSHLCAQCGCIWRPADVATNGIASIRTRGSADTWKPGMTAPIDALTDISALGAAKAAHDACAQKADCNCLTTKPHLRSAIEAAIAETLQRSGRT